ncbi:MAG: Non-specific protein-tyrosine kinase [Dehalococcoidia bacterium]|nr:Non-specific protein-tyrosine kinase [Dehalococcoidia bacterium]
MNKEAVTGLKTLVTYSNPQSPAAEAYRQLRTNVQFSSLDHPIKSLLITSTSLEEGKSTTLANLAITFAQTGNSVILVDCDLRRPGLHELFGVSNERGLTSFFINGSSMEIPLVESGIENLRLITSGPLPPNPSELLGSKRMQDLLDELKSKAGYVLLDSPPIIAVTDAAVLAAQVDGVLLVLRAGKTKRETALKAKAVLERVNANLLGVVLNNVKHDTGY